MALLKVFLMNRDIHESVLSDKFSFSVFTYELVRLQRCHGTTGTFYVNNGAVVFAVLSVQVHRHPSMKVFWQQI